MSTGRLILITLGACLLGMAVAAAAAVVMMDGVPRSLNVRVTTPTITTPMIGVIVFWVVVRALRVPLEPVRTFVYGALVVYGTGYLNGLVITFLPISAELALIFAMLVIIAFAYYGVQKADRDRMGT